MTLGISTQVLNNTNTYKGYKDMKVTPDNLVNQDELINLADVSWTISEAIGSVIDSAIEQTFDYWEEEAGRKQSFNDWMIDNDLDVFHELEIDWDKAMEIGLT